LLRPGLPVLVLALVLPAPARAQADPAEQIPEVLFEDPAAPGDHPRLAPAPPLSAFGPTYVIEKIEVQGNRKTETWLILRELGLSEGDVVVGNDPRVEVARLRLLSLGYFLEVELSVKKGSRRGAAVLWVTVIERGTIILNALHLGTSEATAFWGGLDLTETNFSGRGIALGGGLVASTRPTVPGAAPALGLSLRAAGPPRRDGGLTPFGTLIYASGNEFYRAFGPHDDSDPKKFVAVQTTRAGGTLGVAIDLSRATRVFAEGRYEAVEALFPPMRTRDEGTTRPQRFLIHEGESRLSTLAVTLDIDTRSDPVLPRHGGRASVSLQTGLPLVGSSYAYAKGVAQASWYRPLHRHVLGFHGFAGAAFGDVPYFEQFFVGDLNVLLPQRALGINFSTRPSPNFLRTTVPAHRYETFAARMLVEYAIPLWRRRGFLYRGDAFAAFGAFALASGEDLRVRDTSVLKAIPADLTADLGIRLDTYIGIFTLSFANALGRLPL
jgi:outer membrane protein insertion porin family